MTTSKVAPLVWSLAQTCACERVRFSPLHNAPETAGKAHVICVGTPRGVGRRARASIGDPEECLAPQGISVVRAAGPRQASFWTVSSDGRASASHAEGRRFNPCTVHNA